MVCPECSRLPFSPPPGFTFRTYHQERCNRVFRYSSNHRNVESAASGGAGPPPRGGWGDQQIKGGGQKEKNFKEKKGEEPGEKRGLGGVRPKPARGKRAGRPRGPPQEKTA